MLDMSVSATFKPSKFIKFCVDPHIISSNRYAKQYCIANYIGELPSSEVVDGCGRVELMNEHSPKWHTNCRRGINKQNVESSTVKHRSYPSCGDPPEAFRSIMRK